MLFLLIAGLSIKELGTTGIQIDFTGYEISPQNLRFQGATSFSQPGEPDIPSLNLIVGIPQDGNVDFKVVENQVETFYGIEINPFNPLAIYEYPSLEEKEERGDIYYVDQFYPKNVVEISEPGYFRDINVVRVRLNPVRYNPVKKELTVSRNLKVVIRFRGRPRDRPIFDNSFEEIYQRTVINYSQCKNWRREIPKQEIKNPFYTGVWFKIEVSKEGLYKIGYDELKKAGIDPRQFDPKTMKIYTPGFELLPRDINQPFPDSLIETPVFVEGEDDYSFDKDDYLIFYGFPASHYIPDTSLNWFENGYALNNLYWFTFGGGLGKRMERIDATYSGSQPDTIVTEILHFEEDVHNPTRSGVNWYWQDFSLGSAESTSIRMSLSHKSAYGEARLIVSIFDSMTPSAQPFWIQFKMNGSYFFNDTVILPNVMWLPAYKLTGNGVLNGDTSTFEFKIRRPIGTAATLTLYLNAFDLEYQRLTDMKSPFHAYFNDSMGYTLSCKNVDSRPFVFDITNLRAPMMFDKFTHSGKKIYFSSHCDSFQLLYIAQLNSAINAVLIPAEPGRLRTEDNGCEYLIITHKNFYNSLLPLVNYRRQEFSTKIVTVDKIFDDFSFGKYDPLAIKHFLYHTYNHWKTVPKYVFIVGDGTYDYKNNLRKENPPNFVPMYEWGTTLSGNPGIPPNHIYEGEYVNFFGTEAMVLGRITARNNQEVRDYYEKLIAYEKGDIDGIWNKRIILAADDEYATGWEGTEHSDACEVVNSFVPAELYDRAKIYMLSYKPPPPHKTGTIKPLATEDFIKELNKGALIGCFFGHGNTFQLAHEKLFFESDIPLINNGKRFFFFYFASCTVGRFDDSDHECLAEEFVRMKQGAIGTMGAHAASGTTGNLSIGIQLFRLFTQPDTELTMGECYHIAKHPSNIPTYLLLGDPATKIRKVKGNFNIQAFPDSVRPLERLKVVSDKKPYYLTAYIRDTTHIEWIDTTTMNKISGHIRRLVQQQSGSVIFDYKIEGKEIYQGFWQSDTARIVVPLVTTTHLPMIKLSGYKDQLSAYLDSIRIYGTAVPTTDQIGPEVELYDGARRLKNGDWVDKTFILTGTVTDESGINLLNSKYDARGFFLFVGEDNVTNRIDLRNSFIYDQNSYSQGEFKTTISFDKPQDSITVYVSDNCFNQTIQKIFLNANIYTGISIENILIYPNPLRIHKGIWITFVLSQSAKVTIKIYTIAGRLVKALFELPCHPGYNQRYWDGKDEYGDELSNGVYLVYLLAEGSSGVDKKIEKFIIAR